MRLGRPAAPARDDAVCDLDDDDVVVLPLRQAPLHHIGQPRDAALDEPCVSGAPCAVVVVRRVAHERCQAALAGLGLVGLDGGQALDRRELVVFTAGAGAYFNTAAARSDVGTERPKARPESTAAAPRRALMERRTSASLLRHVSHEMVMTFFRQEPPTSPHGE